MKKLKDLATNVYSLKDELLSTPEEFVWMCGLRKFLRNKYKLHIWICPDANDKFVVVYGKINNQQMIETASGQNRNFKTYESALKEALKAVLLTLKKQ